MSDFRKDDESVVAAELWQECFGTGAGYRHDVRGIMAMFLRCGRVGDPGPISLCSGRKGGGEGGGGDVASPAEKDLS